MTISNADMDRSLVSRAKRCAVAPGWRCGASPRRFTRPLRGRASASNQPAPARVLRRKKGFRKREKGPIFPQRGMGHRRAETVNDVESNVADHNKEIREPAAL
jgi:hypothetical protein